ncbi:MAG TPA: DinB family protein [Terriglobia bacterium]|nr:DinB family protein [Terriglobia bacterium]
MAHKEIERLLSLLDEAYAGPAWHGPCLRGGLRGVTSKQAAQRPGKGRHNIWEIAVHTAYWKYAVRRRLLGEKRGSFGEKGSNWFARPLATGAFGTEAASNKMWRRDLALLSRSHRELSETVAHLQPAALDRRSAASHQTPRRMIAGIAMHDAYHAGQIQLLKRLMERT